MTNTTPRSEEHVACIRQETELASRTRLTAQSLAEHSKGFRLFRWKNLNTDSTEDSRDEWVCESEPCVESADGLVYGYPSRYWKYVWMNEETEASEFGWFREACGPEDHETFVGGPENTE